MSYPQEAWPISVGCRRTQSESGLKLINDDIEMSGCYLLSRCILLGVNEP